MIRTSIRTSIRTCLTVALLASACESAPPPPAPPPAEPTVAPPIPDVGGTPGALSLDTLGPAPGNPAAFVAQSPAPTGAGEAFRRTRALELLRGGNIAAHLPELAHDPNTAFDTHRVQDMAPRARNSTPRILISKPTVNGSLPVEVVRRILRRHLHEIRACYEKRLAAEPRAKGTTSLSWAIDAKGKVYDAKVVKTSFTDTTLPTCMVAAAKTWSFPAPSDEDGNQVKVRYALVPPDR